MLLYFDRNGLRISVNRWSRLYRDPSYGLVRESMAGGLRVETSWVGVAMAWEGAERKLFVTRAIPADGTARRKRPVAVAWSTSLSAAAAAHEFMEEKLKNASAKESV